MPHFIIECSKNIIEIKTPDEIMQQVYNAAEESNLFAEGDIKVRIKPYDFYNNGNQKADFIHIFGYILQGRTVEQKANLTKRIVERVEAMFADVPIISMNIDDFEKETYCKHS
ncbi:5-carboxymethyl-2-hydroxymuconate Delta-isomerase [Fulvivirga sp. 29W222]|uniref:5-carboxymethyl-2-hydroxymuconate Delta-isomerase n=1 Tax=Fulvivirga marina TaxID=2494733 RepID=A0A937FXG2_9BACT|nr:5-carboxymethyl-2-hydroxymuconate Delta-isomerase [Fulvivirga marina]MBL6447955.1 5-carboxymethyl-2-hydroxymuconate Delta-isomerase [Fulvivirga marina]